MEFATVAIGIGVNIPEVRHVIYLEVPRMLELYYQELGRAGRDGKHAKTNLYYNGTDIASNKAGMMDEVQRYCTLSGQCLRSYLLNYLGSQLVPQPPSLQLCYSNCNNCTAGEREDGPLKSGQGTPPTDKVRTVSTLQGLKIKELLKQYRLHLGRICKRFGSIDSTTGFTLKLIDATVLECECLTSAQHIFSTFPIWQKKHAKVIMQVINDVEEVVQNNIVLFTYNDASHVKTLYSVTTSLS